MNELIKVTEQEGRSVVSARELYLGLGLNESNWGKWYKRNIEQNEFSMKTLILRHSYQ